MILIEDGGSLEDIGDFVFFSISSANLPWWLGVISYEGDREHARLVPAAL